MDSETAAWLGGQARALGGLVDEQAYRKTLGKGLVRGAWSIKVAIITGGQRNRFCAGELAFTLRDFN